MQGRRNPNASRGNRIKAKIIEKQQKEKGFGQREKLEFYPLEQKVFWSFKCESKTLPYNFKVKF